MGLTNVKAIADALENVKSIGSICRLIDDKIDIPEYKVIGYHCLPPPGAEQRDPISMVVLSEFSQDEIKNYLVNKEYRFNPFVMRPLQLATPLFWSEIFNLSDLTAQDHSFLAEFGKRFQGFGISVPVYGPFGHNGNVWIRADSAFNATSKAAVMKIQMLCQQAHVVVCGLLKDKASRQVVLTRREQDVLDLVILGKSNSVIADILEISPHTVNGYVRRLYLKLNANDRVSAALRGIALGVAT